MYNQNDCNHFAVFKAGVFMEQEPVYVSSDKLERVCEGVLGRIYDIRQRDKEQYITERVENYNNQIRKSNKIRKFAAWMGIKPRMFITPWGMEEVIKQEIMALNQQDQAAAKQHPIVQIFQSYGDLEHDTRDALIQCSLNETVAVSADMAWNLALGHALDFMRRNRVGFL
ncbi:hypothetical protein [Xanthomonas phage JGB6]|nr:hypothetical protein [Xanthomonas phage JGB6]